MAEEEHALVRPAGKLSTLSLPRKGLAVTRIRLQHVKAGLCVGVRGGGDVAPLGVQDDGQLSGVRMT